MANRVCTFDGLNLNDKVLYWLLQGFNPGDPPLNFDEFSGWDGSAVQRNANRAGIVQLTLPIDVRAATEAALWAGIDAINAKIAGATNEAPKTLAVGAKTFTIVASPLVIPAYDELWYSGIARLSLQLNRR